MSRKVISEEVIKKTGLSRTELATRALLRKAEKARDNLADFYSFVIKHELTKKPLDPAPHQLVMFDFIDHHPHCVIRMPVGTGKTFSMAALTLWLLGNDVTQRGAIVGRSQSQSKKVLRMIKDYIVEPSLKARLNLVFPHLVKSPKKNDPWTLSEITVQRDPAIRDPSLSAVGIDGKISGARLSYLVGDDLLDDVNCRTKESREESISNFEGRLTSRLDPEGARCIVCNTPWHREDLTYYLENIAGWPTLTMDIYGFIRVTNVDSFWLSHIQKTHLKKSTSRIGGVYQWYRLRAHDPDPDETVPLFPERFPRHVIEELRCGKDGKGGKMPHEFARLHLCEPMSDDASRCQKSWVEHCKVKGMGQMMVESYTGSNPTYTGVDLAIGKSKKHDRSVLFTYEELPTGERLILDIESGRMTGPKIIKKIISKSNNYGSSIWVESNAAQAYILQFAIEEQKDLVIRAHTTTRINKYDVDFGVESIFTELQRGIWIIPCDENGQCHREIQKWIDDMIYYQPPPAHTGDHLMACWIARGPGRRRNANEPRGFLGRKREMINVGSF